MISSHVTSQRQGSSCHFDVSNPNRVQPVFCSKVSHHLAPELTPKNDYPHHHDLQAFLYGDTGNPSVQSLYTELFGDNQNDPLFQQIQSIVYDLFWLPNPNSNDPDKPFIPNPAFTNEGNRNHVLAMMQELVTKCEFVRKTSPDQAQALMPQFKAAFVAAVIHDAAKMQQKPAGYVDLESSPGSKMNPIWDPTAAWMRKVIYPASDGKIAFATSGSGPSEDIFTHQYSASVRNMIHQYFGNTSFGELVERAVVSHGMLGSNFVRNGHEKASPLFRDTSLFEHIQYAAGLPGFKDKDIWNELRTACIESIQSGITQGQYDEVSQKLILGIIDSDEILKKVLKTDNIRIGYSEISINEFKWLTKKYLHDGMSPLLKQYSKKLGMDHDVLEQNLMQTISTLSIQMLTDISSEDFTEVTRLIKIKALQLPEKDPDYYHVSKQTQLVDVFMASSDSQSNGIFNATLITKFLTIWKGMFPSQTMSQILDATKTDSPSSIIGLIAGNISTQVNILKTISPENHTLYIPKEMTEQLKSIAKQHGFTNEDFLQQMKQFYNDRFHIKVEINVSQNDIPTNYPTVAILPLIQAFTEGYCQFKITEIFLNSPDCKHFAATNKDMSIKDFPQDQIDILINAANKFVESYGKQE